MFRSRFSVSVYGLFLATFGLLCYLAYHLPYLPGDIAISLWLQGVIPSLFTPIMQAVSYISSLIPAIIIVALVVIGLRASGRKLEPIFIASLTTSATLINWLLKLLIDRPRPGSELILVIEESNGLSFPSGHTVYAVAFYGFLVYLAPKLIKPTAVARALQALLILLTLLTGVSRVYLGAHWPSDILGSLLLSGLLLAPAIALYHNYRIGQGDRNARVT